jgi:hypothetical protein
VRALFSRESEHWATPSDLYRKLDAKFNAPFPSMVVIFKNLEPAKEVA